MTDLEKKQVPWLSGCQWKWSSCRMHFPQTHKAYGQREPSDQLLTALSLTGGCVAAQSLQCFGSLLVSSCLHFSSTPI